jgi:hypothetical protein
MEISFFNIFPALDSLEAVFGIYILLLLMIGASDRILLTLLCAYIISYATSFSYSVELFILCTMALIAYALQRKVFSDFSLYSVVTIVFVVGIAYKAMLYVSSLILLYFFQATHVISLNVEWLMQALYSAFVTALYIGIIFYALSKFTRKLNLAFIR